VPKISLNKTIEATKLNRRTGFAEPGPEITIPFGGLVEHVATERDAVRFTYMGEPYRCSEDLWQAATRESSVPARSGAVQNSGAPAAVAPADAIVWETLASSKVPLLRTKVPGGWLLATQAGSVTFYPDPKHEWNGATVA
jgi:hypothetical protein